MPEAVTTELLDSGLVDACGESPGFACEWIWDTTDNEALAGLVDWLIERPLKVAIILIGALVGLAELMTRLQPHLPPGSLIPRDG